jgi:hypothetical protein
VTLQAATEELMAPCGAPAQARHELALDRS